MPSFRYVHKFENDAAYINYMNNQYESPFFSLTHISGDTAEWTSYRADYEPQPIDLSEVDNNGFPTGTRETANCYVVKKTGWYEFPIVYGCAISAGTQNASAYTRMPLSGGTYSASNATFVNYKNTEITTPYIETDTGDIVNSAEVFSVDTCGYTITDIELVTKDLCKYIRFRVTAMPPLGGNAVIAIRNSSNVIMWSWHIWAYPFIINDCDIPFTSAATETRYHKFMDVNVGWVKDAVGSKYGTSPYYEWGRKDPMPRIVRYNIDTANVLSLVYGTLKQAPSATTIAEGIKNPDTYYLRGATGKTGYGWISGATKAIPRFLNLWNWKFDGRWEKDTPGKTVYDPSPPGYQVPQSSQLVGMTEGTATGGYDWGATWYGRHFQGLSTYPSAGGTPPSAKFPFVYYYTCTNCDTGDTTYIQCFFASAGTQSTAATFDVLLPRYSYKAAGMVYAPIRVE